MQLAGWNTALISNCFNVDFKYHLKAIDSISEFLSNSDNEDAILHNSDLIFKWIALRFFDTNPSVILRMFDLLLRIFDVMKERKILLSEIEAQNFIPHMIVKTGDPKDVLRQKVHDVLDRIKDIYSPIKLYTYVAAGLNSKNSRQRTTCLEELSYFIKIYGTTVCQPSSTTACKEIAKQIGDKDGAVRNAALNCLLEIYHFEGEKLLKILANLKQKELEMLEKRLKRANRTNDAIIVKPLEATILIKEQSIGVNQRQAISPEPVEECNERKQEQNFNSQIVKPNNSACNSKTLIKPRSALVRPVSKLIAPNNTQSNHTENVSPPQHHQYSPPNANNNHLREDKSPSPEMLTYTTPSMNRGSAIRSRIANSIMNHQQQQQQLKPIQLDFEDTDQEYNKIESKETKYSTYRTSTAYKAARASSKEYDAILNESSIDLPKRRSTFSVTPSNYSSTQIKQSDKNLKMLYANLVSSEVDVVIDTLNRLNEILNDQKQATLQFSDTINELIMRCSMQLRLVKTKYSKSNDTKVNDLFQHVTLTLYLVFKNQVLAKKISSEALIDLMPRAFDFLIYKKLNSKLEDTVNNIIFLILMHADLTQILLTIIRLLHRFIAEDKDGKQSEHTDLTIKCFWKLTRLVEKFDQHLNVREIVIELKNFLEAFPSSYWKSNPAKNETAYRTIKTLIYIMAKSKKQRIFLYMDKIPNKENTALYKLFKKAIDQVNEENKMNEENRDELTIVELNHINDILINLRDDFRTDYFEQIIEFCEQHPTFNLKEFMQEFYSEFFTNCVQEKLAELRTTGDHKQENGLRNGHYSTDSKSTTDNINQASYTSTTGNRSSVNHQQTQNSLEMNHKGPIDKKLLIELRRLSTKPEDLNVDNVNEWYKENMRALGMNEDKKIDNGNLNNTDNLDEAVRESFRRTENILIKTKKFLQQHEK